jgi:hypothetical protein
VFELILEILFEVVVSGVFDRWSERRVASQRPAAFVRSLVAGVGIAVGVIGGYLWGYYAAGQLSGGTPRSLWVSLTMGAVALAFALTLHQKHQSEEFVQAPGQRSHSWPRRLATVGAFNLVTAAGIAWGAAAV